MQFACIIDPIEERNSFDNVTFHFLIGLWSNRICKTIVHGPIASECSNFRFNLNELKFMHFATKLHTLLVPLFGQAL